MINGILGKAYGDSAIITHEVHDSLKGHYECMDLYYQLQYQFTVEEDWGVPGLYVVGRINADLSKIREVVEPELESATFDEGWNGLLKSGIVEVAEKGIALPLLIGKLDVLDDFQVRLAHQRDQLEKIHATQGRLLEDHDELSRTMAELRAALERASDVADDNQRN